MTFRPPMPQPGECGPEGRHTAPDPVDGPTSCPCGVLTRIPPPRPAEPR